MATKNLKDTLAAELGIELVKRGRKAKPITTKLNPKAKRIVITFNAGKNGRKADVQADHHIDAGKGKVMEFAKSWADANGYTLTDFGSVNVIVLTK